jgi:predicted ATPase
MNKKGIGFTNFRRFQKFPILEFSPITYLVGRNNSGKSTMVKALLLSLDYLQNQLSDTFSFDSSILEDANIVTFGRALCNSAEKPKIVFEVRLDDYDFQIEISGLENQTRPSVQYLVVSDASSGFSINLNYQTLKARVSKHKTASTTENEYLSSNNKLDEEISTLQKNIDEVKKGSKEYLNLIDSLNKLKERKSKINQESSSPQDDFDYELEYPLFHETHPSMRQSSLEGVYHAKDEGENSNSFELDIPRTEENELKEIVSTFLYYNTIAYRKQIEKRNLQEEDVEESGLSDVIELYNTRKVLENWIEKLIEKVNLEHFVYLGANPSKQSALFQLRDKNNALAQAIHQFKQLDIGESSEEGMFVKHWMRIFEVGHSYKIEFFAGEAYQFHVIEESGGFNHLSDKGMGSLQAMTLILKIACLIKLKGKSKNNITLLVEEPELNLHPALQSKLTDFFHVVNSKYGFNFIVETHSEYIVRRSQLLALENDYLSNQKLNPNPFSIFYFHKDEGPYQMEYNKNGKFNRDFGPGFYDEAGSLTLKMIKELRKNQTR